MLSYVLMCFQNNDTQSIFVVVTLHPKKFICDVWWLVVHVNRKSCKWKEIRTTTNLANNYGKECELELLTFEGFVKEWVKLTRKIMADKNQIWDCLGDWVLENKYV